ncbi:hypothetical protein GO986_02110 [Deinococcus sp. HMF7620]|uniref:Pilin A4 domain-containing protein n=1 Tax=Deinococcus arboris TaxID=2682977 RepID=A0A7C9HPK3_9DEIO|nr:hypothetical protein [Deinococcus arboris]MVN85554.1 hypothetical protein [Deinococcus arboris]
MLKGWTFLALGALLCSCNNPIEAHNKRRDQQLMHDNALYYRRQCIEALERIRATSTPQVFAAALNGQGCQSPLLGDYALQDNLNRTVQGSVITLDLKRLSDYTLEVTGLNGQTYEYVDGGDAAAAAEQDGTFTETAPDVVSPDGDGGRVVDEATP